MGPKPASRSRAFQTDILTSAECSSLEESIAAFCKSKAKLKENKHERKKHKQKSKSDMCDSNSDVLVSNVEHSPPEESTAAGKSEVKPKGSRRKRKET